MSPNIDFKLKNLTETINKIHFAPIPRKEYENFKDAIQNFYSSIQTDNKEDNLKYKLIKFLEQIYPNYKNINIKDNIDLVVSKSEKSPTHLLFETKKISDKNDMVSKDDFNKKSMWQVILYYLRERIEKKNTHLKKIIITNFKKWFIFDNNDFESIIFSDIKLINEYKESKNEKKNNEFFYKEIASRWIESNINKFNHKILYFNLDDYFLDGKLKQDEKTVIELYRVFSKHYLLKEPYKSYNELDTDFYKEILYLMGVEEVSKNGNLYIQRCKKNKRQKFSLLENTISNIEVYKQKELREEEKFEIGFELCIIWINRILFLKLLESQIIAYNKKQNIDASFLNAYKITDFSDLNSVFLEVLPEASFEKRKELGFEYLPYLNSSLFEVSKIEKEWFSIGLLKNKNLDKFENSAIENKQTSLPFLQYFFEFLDSYDFSAENFSEIRESNKTLINSSVLGLLFEKINGYKLGSHFTPSEITMFMARESLHKTVLSRFRAKTKKKIENFNDILKNFEEEERKEIINSLKICDPSVGSGHFLVSVLNELIYIKFELRIIEDYYKYFDNLKLSIKNDELVLYNTQKGKFFEYYLNEKGEIVQSSQAIQEILFHEKKYIIENCLFGVDINKKSVYICRLRLWIELLKSTYYIKDISYKELNTLPNIDINIKDGDALLSFLTNDLDLEKKLKKEDFLTYKTLVHAYKNTSDKLKRSRVENQIENIKKEFINKAKEKSRNIEFKNIELDIRQKEMEKTQISLNQKTKKEIEKGESKIQKEILKAKDTYEERIKFFENQPKSFEWRLEFPEILDEHTFFFNGFDLIIGNPPYIQLQKDNSYLGNLYEKENYKTFDKMGDMYALFYEKSKQLVKLNGFVCLITSNKWMRAGYGKVLRNFLSEKTNTTTLIDLGAHIFDSATVDTNILIYQNSNTQQKSIDSHILDVKLKNIEKEALHDLFLEKKKSIQPFTKDESWIIMDDLEKKIKKQIEKIGIPLKKWDISIYRGILTGFNDAFIIDSKKREEILRACEGFSEDDFKGKKIKDLSKTEYKRTKELIKPILKRDNIKKYNSNWSDLWIIGTHNGYRNENGKKIGKIDIKFYPSIKNHLNHYLEQIQNRQDRGDTAYNLRNCAYYKEFEKEKIIWKQTSILQTFTFDDKNYFLDVTSQFLTGKYLKYILSILNSKVSNFFIKKLSYSFGEEGTRWIPSFIEKTPIPQIRVEKQKPFEILVDSILYIKEKKLDSSLSELLEDIIDKMVLDLYFEDLSKKHQIYALESLKEIVLKFENKAINEKNITDLVNHLIKCKEYKEHQNKFLSISEFSLIYKS